MKFHFTNLHTSSSFHREYLLSLSFVLYYTVDFNGIDYLIFKLIISFIWLLSHSFFLSLIWIAYFVRNHIFHIDLQDYFNTVVIPKNSFYNSTYL